MRRLPLVTQFGEKVRPLDRGGRTCGYRAGISSSRSAAAAMWNAIIRMSRPSRFCIVNIYIGNAKGNPAAAGRRRMSLLLHARLRIYCFQVDRSVPMSVPENYEDVLAIALRYTETRDEEEISSIIAMMGGLEEHQALAIMRGSGNELGPVEELVALARLQLVVTRAEAIRILDEVAGQHTGPRP